MLLPADKLADALRAARDWLLPPRCMGCGEVLADGQGLCPGCWAGVTRIARPRCTSCGLPLLMSPPGDESCDYCLAEPPAFEMARAALVYDDAAKPLILRFKHGDRMEFAPGLARLMLGAAEDMPARADVIVPIPLHPKRLRRRRFNQAAELARCLALQTGVPAAPLVLKRLTNTPPQGGLSRLQRARNLSGAFAVREGQKAQLDGATVLLVDDVHTTGATLNEAARTLRSAGASTVLALTVAQALPKHYTEDPFQSDHSGVYR